MYKSFTLIKFSWYVSLFDVVDESVFLISFSDHWLYRISSDMCIGLVAWNFTEYAVDIIMVMVFHQYTTKLNE